MKTCKVKPTYTTCRMCVDMQMTLDVIKSCVGCELDTGEYELLQVGTGFWSGDYAIVQKDGKIEKVALSRVYDIKNEK